MEVKEQPGRSRGWLSAAAIFGVVGALTPKLAACPLGWLAVGLGFVPALLLPKYPLPARWEKSLSLLRGVWALEVMAVTLGLCARGLQQYCYDGWSIWMPALLILAVGWRGGSLEPKARERLGKLLVFLLLGMGAVLVLFLLPRLEWRNLAVRSGADVWTGTKLFLLTLGAASAIMPVAGPRPGLVTTAMGSGAVALTTGGEGAALAGLLSWPLLNFSDAAVFGVRLSSFAGAMWAVSESALLACLLSRFPGGKWVKTIGAGLVLALTFTLPWADYALEVLLAFGAALAYLPMLWAILHKRLTGETYI